MGAESRPGGGPPPTGAAPRTQTNGAWRPSTNRTARLAEQVLVAAKLRSFLG